MPCASPKFTLISPCVGVGCLVGPLVQFSHFVSPVFFLHIPFHALLNLFVCVCDAFHVLSSVAAAYVTAHYEGHTLLLDHRITSLEDHPKT